MTDPFTTFGFRVGVGSDVETRFTEAGINPQYHDAVINEVNAVSPTTPYDVFGRVYDCPICHGETIYVEVVEEV